MNPKGRALAVDIYKRLRKANANAAEERDELNDLMQEQALRLLRIADDRMDTEAFTLPQQRKYLWHHARAQRQRFYQRVRPFEKGVLSLDMAMGEDDDHVTLYDMLPAPAPVERESSTDMDRMLGCLCDRCAGILRGVLVEEKTFEEVAHGSGLSRQRMKQLYDVALARVRNFMQQGLSPHGCRDCKKKDT